MGQSAKSQTLTAHVDQSFHGHLVLRHEVLLFPLSFWALAISVRRVPRAAIKCTRPGVSTHPPTHRSPMSPARGRKTRSRGYSTPAIAKYVKDISEICGLISLMIRNCALLTHHRSKTESTREAHWTTQHWASDEGRCTTSTSHSDCELSNSIG